MGVDTKLFIASKWRVSEIKEVLARKLSVSVATQVYADMPDYLRLNFTLPDGAERGLSVHLNSTRCGFDGITLSLGASGRALEIMQALAGTFGGFLNPADVDDTFQAFNGDLDESDGLAFWVRCAIVNGVNHEDAEALTQFIADTKARWNKNRVSF